MTDPARIERRFIVMSSSPGRLAQLGASSGETLLAYNGHQAI